MIILATLGFLPVSFATAVTIGHFEGIGWEIASAPFLVCLGLWYGIVTARSQR